MVRMIRLVGLFRFTRPGEATTIDILEGPLQRGLFLVEIAKPYLPRFRSLFFSLEFQSSKAFLCGNVLQLS
jgi:hypothetical protein